MACAKSPTLRWHQNLGVQETKTHGVGEAVESYRKINDGKASRVPVSGLPNLTGSQSRSLKALTNGSDTVGPKANDDNLIN